jgi:hypothetical protein
MPVMFPTDEEIAYAVNRAIAYRRDQARRKPEYCLASDAALQERITGYATRPEPYGVGWWIVGVLVDDTDLEHNEYSIVMVPGQRMLRTTPRNDVVPPAPPKRSRTYFSGATKRWEIDPDVPEDGDLADYQAG